MSAAPSFGRLRYYLYPVLVVALVGLVFAKLGISPSLGGSTPERRKVEIGKDYYVTVSLIELAATNGDDSWDSVDESGPDIYVEIFWKGNRIYRSTTKDDTFVAKWSNAEMSLRDLAISGSKTSMDDLIRAARLNVRAGETIEIKVFESDLIGATAAGEMSLPVTGLEIGDHTYEFQTGGLRRIILRVLDMQDAVDPLR